MFLIDDIRSKEHQPDILVDAGNLLFDRAQIDESDEENIARGKGIAKIYSLMNYDAIAVGPLDLAMGLELFSNEELAHLPWVSANLYKADGTLAFQPYLTKTIDGLKVGIVGITESQVKNPRGYSVTNGLAELADLMPRLARSHDFIILLTTISYKRSLTLAENHPNLHVIVGGDRRKGNINGQKRYGSVLVQTADQGKYLGILRTTWRYQGWDTNIPKQLNDLRTQEQSLEIQLKKIELSDGNKDQKNIRKDVLEIHREKIIAQIKRLEEELKNVSDSKPASTFVSETIPLSPMIPQDSKIEELVRSIID